MLGEGGARERDQETVLLAPILRNYANDRHVLYSLLRTGLMDLRFLFFVLVGFLLLFFPKIKFLIGMRKKWNCSGRADW